MNPYYVAYCRAQGRDPEAQKTHDTKRWPGGKMAGFMLWIQEAWRTWAAEAGEVKHGAWDARQSAAFGVWLATQ